MVRKLKRSGIVWVAYIQGRRGGVRIQTHVFSQSSVYVSQLLALSREVMSPPPPAHM